MRFSPGCQCCGEPTTVVVPPCCSSQPIPRTLYLTIGRDSSVLMTDCGAGVCHLGVWELTWNGTASRWESAVLDCTAGVLAQNVKFLFYCDGVSAFNLEIQGDCSGSYARINDSSTDHIVPSSCDPFSWTVPLSRDRLVSGGCPSTFSCKFTASVSE